MSKKIKLNPITSAIGTAVLATAGLTANATAAENPFIAETLDTGYMLAGGDKAKEGKCGEGKCGGDKAKDKAHDHANKAKGDMEGKCGEEHKAKMKEHKAKMEGKCGEGKCGGDKAKAEAHDHGEKAKADMEGKCGEAHKAANEGKCGGRQ